MTRRNGEGRAPRLAWLGIVALTGALFACSSSERSASLDAPDASTAHASGASGTPVDLALRLAAPDAELAKRLATTSAGWQRTADGIISPGLRGASTGPAYD